MIDEKIYSLLRDGATGAIVKSNIFPVIIPQNTPYPSVRYINTDTQPERHKNSPLALMDRANYQIDVFAEKFDDCAKIAAAVRKDLEGYRDPDTNLEILFENIRDGYENENNIFRKILDFEIHTK